MPFEITTQGVKVVKETWVNAVDHIKEHYNTEEISDLFNEKDISIVKLTDVTQDAGVFFRIGPLKADIDF